MLLLTLVTARSITHTFAPVFVTVADAFFIIPANIDVIWIMRNTENVMPHEQRGELALVVDEELVGDAEDAEHGKLHRAANVPPAYLHAFGSPRA